MTLQKFEQLGMSLEELKATMIFADFIRRREDGRRRNQGRILSARLWDNL